jgi:hypothetical protein
MGYIVCSQLYAQAVYIRAFCVHVRVPGDRAAVRTEALLQTLNTSPVQRGAERFVPVERFIIRNGFGETDHVLGPDGNHIMGRLPAAAAERSSRALDPFRDSSGSGSVPAAWVVTGKTEAGCVFHRKSVVMAGAS